MRTHIAIVDDDACLSRAMARLLGAYSYDARCYPSARHFLDSLNSETPDCLILDYRMDGMSGLELLNHLAGTEFRIPTIMITADDEPGLRHRCKLAGAFCFLTKPAPGDALLNAIHAATQEALPVAAEVSHHAV